MKTYQFSQIGKRSNNEDSLGTSAALLTVCDGMGGHNYGERASAFVKEAMLKAFAVPQQLGKMEIQQQLNKVQTDLNQLLENEPELEKMGTTFTGVFITPDVWYAAHIGDSRIYLFRPSEKKLWHTWDHSLVGELMRTKEITIEAGRFHPMSNRISKAIIAQKDGKPVSASIVKIDELKKGDIFLLCSDGVVEGWGDWELVQLLSDESLSFEQKCKKIAQLCNAKSKDNNTAIIAEIGAEDAFSYGTNAELEWTTFTEVEADYKQYVKDNEEVEEEEPQSEAPVIPQPKMERPSQETKTPETLSSPNPQQATTPRQAKPVAPPVKTDKSPIKRFLPMLLALLLLVVGVVVLLKSRKPADDPDTKAYNACKSVMDYRAYLSEYGNDALHYADAKAFIDNYMADSIQKAQADRSEAEARASKNELERKEKMAYDACTTVGACDSYLSVYPQGRYVKEVREKRKQLQKEEKRKAEAEKKENDAFKKCNTIEACNSYLMAYPQGRYLAEVRAKKEELEEQAKSEAGAKANEQVEKDAAEKIEAELKAKAEAEKKEDAAYKKCTTVEGCNAYLKTYPQGRYVVEVNKKKEDLTKAAENKIGGIIQGGQTSWKDAKDKKDEHTNHADTTKVK